MTGWGPVSMGDAGSPSKGEEPNEMLDCVREGAGGAEKSQGDGDATTMGWGQARRQKQRANGDRHPDTHTQPPNIEQQRAKATEAH